MDVLGLTRLIPKPCKVYGTAYGLEQKGIDDIRDRIVKELPGGYTNGNNARINIENVDCLKLLRNNL